MVLYLALLEFIVKGIDLVVEPRCADLAGFIEEVDGEKTALAALIMPLLDIRFISHADLNGPSSISYVYWYGRLLVLVGREAFDGVDGDVATA
jgi:hypothetical protein